uniref:AB hydrolase-1 domain-containing protein n=1 Tax=Eptatretus burgeri TaxID=7764 RepID=A0A8C4NFM0_EPTBU
MDWKSGIDCQKTLCVPGTKVLGGVSLYLTKLPNYQHEWDQHELPTVILKDLFVIDFGGSFKLCFLSCFNEAPVLTFQRPRLIAGPAFRTFLLECCPVLRRRFWPTFWCLGGRSQTLLRFLLKSKPLLTYRTELLRTADGGQLSLDWLEGPSQQLNPQLTVLLLPGLTSNSRENYILHLAAQAQLCVVFNYRGCGKEDLLTPRLYCAANTEDMSLVVHHIRSVQPRSPILAVGLSMGGMLLLNFLAEQGQQTGVDAAMTISVPWDAFTSTASLEEPLNKMLFNCMLTRLLTGTVRRYFDIMVLWKVVNVCCIPLQARTVWEYDERLISVMFGFRSNGDYYHAASPFHKVPAIHVPVLCLNAADDPLSPECAFPVEAIQISPCVALAVTEHGGHLAFLEGAFPCGESFMDRLFHEFASMILSHGPLHFTATQNHVTNR